MISSNNKERKISYDQKLFIKTSLRQLGINPKNNGLLIFQEAITYAYSKDMIIINLEEIYRYIAQKHENKSFLEFIEKLKQRYIIQLAS